MATEAPHSSGSSALSAAEKLMQQHAAHESHNPTVEEVPDEDALPHPAPSAATSQPTADPTPAAESTGKAAGKQPVHDAPAKRPALDTKSEELFPALGAPKSAAPAAPSMWSKKPAVVAKAANGIPNGVVNGTGAADTSSRASNPMSGMVTPTSTAQSQRGPSQVSLPGRNSESIDLPPSYMTPRDQLKKPVEHILRDINKRSKANVVMKSGPGGNYRFEGTGPIDAVRTALKEVASQLCSKQKASVPIPMSLRGRIVGKQGATIQAISKRTGARINISKQEAAEILEDDDLDSTVDVTIEGDPFAVQMAKQDIEKIVNEHTSSASTRLKHIPAEYYPFLAPAYNQRLNALQQGRDLNMQFPQYHTWNRDAQPQLPDNRQPASFAAQAGLPIFLSGDRQAVADARAEIDRQVQELERQLTLEQLDVERSRHQFIVGKKGKALEDFLAETGCTVILPPDGTDDETVIVVGPADKIDEAKDKVMELASSMATATADIARAHANAPRGAQNHARDITRYLQQRQAIQELERTHDATIVPDSTGNWHIYASEGKNAIKARADVMNLIAGHPPARFHPIQIDPFYHQHIREHAAPQIREQHGVRVVIPDGAGDVLLVFEDRAPSPEYTLPRKAPNQQETKAFQQALQEAQQQILALMSGRPAIVSRDLDAPHKFHPKIQRHVDRHHQSLGQGQIPVQVTYGGSPQAGSRRPNVGLRGPQNDVDALEQMLKAFIEQEEKDELERGFTLSFEFPQRHANHLIGRKGENINKLREEHDVDIQLNDGKCEIKGPEAKANACKKEILAMVKKLDDEATHRLNIAPEFHKDLIGAQGSQVNRLQDRYGVRVQFPRNKQNDDDASIADGSSRRDNQQPNEVIVKGPSRGADACRDELLSLLQYVKDNSYVATVSVAQNQLPSLIGAGGKEMEALRLETGAQVDVPSSRDTAGPDGRVEIKIKGSKKAVDDAKKLIQEKAKVYDNTVVRNLDVDRKLHRIIIGAQGK